MSYIILCFCFFVGGMAQGQLDTIVVFEQDIYVYQYKDKDYSYEEINKMYKGLKTLG